MSSLRKTDQATGRAVKTHASGETPREARRERELRDVQIAINKGYRNKAVENFFKR